MKASHLFAGGGFAGFVATIAVYALGKVGVRLSPEDAAVIGSAALAASAGLAQQIEKAGLRGLFARLWKGSA